MLSNNAVKKLRKKIVKLIYRIESDVKKGCSIMCVEVQPELLRLMMKEKSEYPQITEAYDIFESDVMVVFNFDGVVGRIQFSDNISEETKKFFIIRYCPSSDMAMAV